MHADSFMNRIENLDLSLFQNIHSQTAREDQIALLAIQRITAKMHKEYSYLEIGSYMGGSIQPHLLDSRCRHIYSIDTRHLQVPDDRSAGYFLYEDNSSEKMIELLRNIEPHQVSKIQCFETDASVIKPEEIGFRPQIALIDGEHTSKAVLSDFNFCRKVLSHDGTIIFDDLMIVYPAIIEICRVLEKSKRRFLPLKLGDRGFAVFFDPRKVYSDRYLQQMHKQNRNFLKFFRLQIRLREILPAPLWSSLRSLRDALRMIGKRLFS